MKVIVKIETDRTINELLKERGSIARSAHIGNQYLGNIVCAKLGFEVRQYPFTMVADKTGNRDSNYCPWLCMINEHSHSIGSNNCPDNSLPTIFQELSCQGKKFLENRPSIDEKTEMTAFQHYLSFNRLVKTFDRKQQSPLYLFPDEVIRRTVDLLYPCFSEAFDREMSKDNVFCTEPENQKGLVKRLIKEKRLLIQSFISQKKLKQERIRAPKLIFQLAALVVEGVLAGRQEIIHLSGSGMHDYIQRYEPDLNKIFRSVEGYQKFGFIVVPTYNWRIVAFNNYDLKILEKAIPKFLAKEITETEKAVLRERMPYLNTEDPRLKGKYPTHYDFLSGLELKIPSEFKEMKISQIEQFIEMVSDK